MVVTAGRGPSVATAGLLARFEACVRESLCMCFELFFAGLKVLSRTGVVLCLTVVLFVFLLVSVFNCV